MASVPDIAQFIVKPRNGSIPKPRPVMKLKWGKLLAEATEQDVNSEREIVNKEAYLDDEYSEVYRENSNTNTNTITNTNDKPDGNDEGPLNLCNKSHTMPMPGNSFPQSLKALDLSETKQGVKGIKENRKSNEFLKDSLISSLQLNQVSQEKIENVSKKNNSENFLENKENLFSNNNKKNIYSTPCNKRPEKMMENFDKVRSCCKNEGTSVKQNLLFFSEKKQTPKILLSENVKAYQENIKRKDILDKRKAEMNDKINQNLGQIKPSVTLTPISEKFAVPVAPFKHKEATKSLVINKKSYQILAPLGKGGSSKVYLVLSSENELLAVKCVKLSDVSESIKNDYLNEIQHLLKLQHSRHVIKLYDHQYLSAQKLLLTVMEKGDTDLSRFLKDKASSSEGISPELIMYYWTEMLLAVKCIHENNIIHRDLKPANFLLVSGRLKLIDFGIASSIQTEQTSILMDSQSGTYNYMSPEALQDLGLENKIVLKIGRKTDVWSLGCILYYFLYKKTPYQDIVKPLHKFKAITDPTYVVPFPKISGVPEILIESCKKCLVHDPKKRASIEELLDARNRPLFSLTQVLTKLENILSESEYKKVEKAFEE